MNPFSRFSALAALLALAAGVGPPRPATAQETSRTSGRAERPSDRWHRLHHDYFMEEPPPPRGPLRFGLCPGLGIRLATPGGLVGTADLFVSFSRPRAFSLFAGLGIEGTTAVRAAVFTVGWGGVRSVHGARFQSGFFGAFLRYRDYVGESAGSRRDAISAGTEIGGGTLALTMEIGASRRLDGRWHALAAIGVKLIRAVPIGG